MREAILGSEAVATGTITRSRLRWNYRPYFPDVYLPRGSVPDIRTKAHAAWLWSRRRAVVTGRAAAALHGAKWVDDGAPVELIWANNHCPRGIVTRRDRVADDEVCRVGEIAVSTPARTALDLGRYLPRLPAVIHLDALARATDVKPSDAMVLTDRYRGSRGVKRCRDAIALMDAGAQSPKETWLRLLLIDAGFPPPQTQIPLYVDGHPVAFLDMGWPHIKVSAEYDGDHHRSDRITYVKDIGRAEFIDRMGWLNVRVVAEHDRANIVDRVFAAWTRREREGMVVNWPEPRPGILFRGRS